MKISICIPNDYNSGEAILNAISDCYEGDAAACAEDKGERMLETLAAAARIAGLRYIEATDFGAIWEGSEGEWDTAKDLLPKWAYLSVSDVEE